MVHCFGQLLLGFAFAVCELGIRRRKLSDCLGIGQHRDGLLKRLDVVWRLQDRRRSPVHCDNDAIVLPVNAADKLRKVCLDLSQGQSLAHGHKYDQNVRRHQR